MTDRAARRLTRHLLVVLTLAAAGSVVSMPPLQSQASSSTTAPAPPRDANARASTAATGTMATGTIRGRVVDAAEGNPLHTVRIELFSSAAPEVFTDADGRFTITTLPAGRYWLAASKAGYVTAWRRDRPVSDAFQVAGPPVTLAAGQTEQVEIALWKGGVVSGRVVDHRGRDVIGARVYVAREQWRDGRQQMAPAAGVMDQTDDLGEFRLFGLPAGAYLLAVAILKPANEGLITVYAPGTFGTDAAERLDVRSGTERTMTITLPPAPTASIVGVVRDADGRVQGRVHVHAAMVGSSERDWSQLGNETHTDGTYRFTALVPGEYEVSARASSTFAVARVRVDGTDVTVPLTLGEGATIHGRYRFDIGAPPPTVKPPSSVRAGVLPVSLPYNDARRMTIGEDWRFTISGLVGNYRITPYQPAGWFVKRITRDGRDITHEPVDVASGTIDGIEVLLTQKTTQLSVTVDGTDAELEDTTVLIFAEDESKHWLMSPFVRTVRTAQRRSTPTLQWRDTRSLTVTGLPPARYYAVALSPLEAGRETDRALLRQLAAGASKVALEEDSSRAITLKVMPVP